MEGGILFIGCSCRPASLYWHDIAFTAAAAVAVTVRCCLLEIVEHSLNIDVRDSDCSR